MATPKKVVYTNDDIALFISRFNTGAYATQNAPKDSGKSPGYTPGGKTALTDVLVRKHLDGVETLGSYCISPSGFCKFLVLDFDVATMTERAARQSPESIEAQSKLKSEKAKLWQEVQDSIKILQSQMQIDRSSIIIEHSGNKGYHCWIFLAEDLPSVEVFNLTRTIARVLNCPKREIYPLQPTTGTNGWGSLIKLPFGVHRKTGNRCLFLTDELDKQGEPVPDPDPWTTLRNVTPLTITQVRNLNKLMDTEDDQVGQDFDPDFFYNNGSIDRMIEGCSALQGMRDRAKTAGDDGQCNMPHTERKAMMCLFQPFKDMGLAKAHEWLKDTHNYNSDMVTAIMTEKRYSPMCCDTMISGGICRKKCDKITQIGGKSPIKLALDPSRAKESAAVVLKSLGEIENPILNGRRVVVDFSVPSLIETPYASCKKVTFNCCAESTCSKYDECDHGEKNKEKVINFAPSNPIHIQVIGMDSAKVDSFHKACVGCENPKSLQKKSDEKIYVQAFLASNCLTKVSTIMKAKVQDARVVAKENKDYIAYVLSSSLESSKDYRGLGTIVANPSNQQVTLLLTHIEPLQGTVDSFEVTPDIQPVFDQLKSLDIEDWIDDFRTNITCIHGRDHYIMATLLTYFSVLDLEFNKTRLQRGWVEMAVVGDTGQAKSTMIRSIMDHLGMGYLESSNVSAAGLIGGCEKIGNKNMIKWGSFPRCNKSLLFIDEIQAMPREIWMQLRQIRSDGIAKVTKIQSGTHEAKVRLIVAMNPIPGEKSMADFRRGCQSIATVMDQADIRRFDLALFLSKEDLDKDYSNTENTKENPLITSEMFKMHILWTWSRKREHIIYSPEVTKAILSAARQLSQRFGGTPSIPLCNASDMREKLARLVASLACMRLRTDDYIYVHPQLEDVEFIVGFLEKLYSHKNVCLHEESGDRIRATEMDEDQYEAIMRSISTQLVDKEHPEKTLAAFMSACKLLSEGVEQGTMSVASWTDTKPEIASKMLTIMSQHHMVQPSPRGFSATSKINRFIRYHDDYLKKEFFKGVKTGAEDKANA